MATPKPKFQFDFLPKILNGGIAGIVGVTCVFPIDLAKTRLQNQTIGPNGERMYKSLLDCFVKTAKGEGFFGMYRGLAVNVTLITPEKAAKLVGNDLFRYMLRTPSGKLTLPREMVAGSCAALCQMFATVPMELLKIQLQDAGRTATKAQTGGVSGSAGAAAAGVVAGGSGSAGGTAAVAPATKKLSAVGIAVKLVKERGFFGLYKGLFSTICRDCTFSAIYFPLFAHLNHLGVDEKLGHGSAPFYWSFISACIAGGTGSFCANPFDVVKTRLQTITKAADEIHYTGIPDCFRRTYVNEGLTAFFKGGLCRILVIAPLFGIAQTVYYLGVAETIMGRKKSTYY